MPSAVVPATEIPAPTVNPGALGSATPGSGDPATPVGGAAPTGSNTPVGTGGHHGVGHRPTGSAPVSADAPGDSTTGAPPATAETVAA